MRRVCVIMAVACLGMRAEIVDRIAATVGFEVISESRIEDQIRIGAFIEGTDPDLSLDNRRKTLEQLIEQTLIRREVEFTRFPPPSDADVRSLLDQVTARHPRDLGLALARYGITEEELVAQLRWQLTMLRFIEYRFQPAVDVADNQMQQEYRRQVTRWREKNQGEPPSFEQMRPDLEKIVRQKLTDSALDRWLGEVRTQNVILYRGEYR